MGEVRVKTNDNLVNGNGVDGTVTSAPRRCCWYEEDDDDTRLSFALNRSDYLPCFSYPSGNHRT